MRSRARFPNSRRQTSVAGRPPRRALVPYLAAMRDEIGETWFLIRAELGLVRPLSHFPKDLHLSDIHIRETIDGWINGRHLRLTQMLQRQIAVSFRKGLRVSKQLKLQEGLIRRNWRPISVGFWKSSESARRKSEHDPLAGRRHTFQVDLAKASLFISCKHFLTLKR
jgi:hypothetical protein